MIQRPAPVDPAREEFDRLGRILALEVRGGYRDRAVIGGLSGYARNLVARLAAGEAPSAHQRIAARLTEVLASYSAHDPMHRPELIAAAQALLAASPDDQASAAGEHAALRAVSAPLPRDAAPAGAGPTGTPQSQPPPPVPPRRRKPDAAFPAPDRPLLDVPGVGPGRRRLLARLGLEVVEDLLYHFPGRHLDYPPPARASDLFFQQRASFEGTVRRVEVRRTARGLQRITAVLGDATGEVEAVWFRAGYGLRLAPGQRIAVSGDLVLNGRRPAFENPD